MGYGSPIVAALVLSASLLPAAVSADNVTASASARITLHLPPRVELRREQDGGRERLCLSHIPGWYFSVQFTSSGEESGRQMAGQSGSYCLSADITKDADSIMIVAQ